MDTATDSLTGAICIPNSAGCSRPLYRMTLGPLSLPPVWAISWGLDPSSFVNSITRRYLCYIDVVHCWILWLLYTNNGVDTFQPLYSMFAHQRNAQTLPSLHLVISSSLQISRLADERLSPKSRNATPNKKRHETTKDGGVHLEVDARCSKVLHTCGFGDDRCLDAGAAIGSHT